MNSKALSSALNNPEIKDFLSSYQQNERSEVIKLSMLHTIYSLKSSFSSYPSIADLRDIMSNAGKIKSLESTIASMKQKLESIKREIFTLENSLNKPAAHKTENVEKVQKPQKEVVSVLKPPSFQGKSTHRSHSAPHLTKASSQWRQGDTSIFRNHYAEIKPANSRNYLFRDVSPQSLRGHHYKEYLTEWNNEYTQYNERQNPAGIYPQWWMALTELDIKPEKQTAKVTQIKYPKTERKVWVEAPGCPEEEEERIEEPRTIVPKQRLPQSVKFMPKTSEKAAEANIPSIESSGNEARVHFSDKKYAGWVGDFSKVVKGSGGKVSNSVSKEISYTESSRKDHSSGYTSSSMTNYVPTSEMRQFYQGEFNKFLESKNGESYTSGRMRSPYQNSLSSEDQKSSFL